MGLSSLFFLMPAVALAMAAPNAQPLEPDGAERIDVPAPLVRIEQAHQFVADKAWDELYLATAAAIPARFDSKTRGAFAQLLLVGANAEGVDHVLALALAEKSLQFEEKDEGLLRASDLALTIGDQPAALQYLEKAMARRPTDDRLRMRRAGIACLQRDWVMAERLYTAITKASPEYASAQQALERFQSERAKDESMAIEGAQRDLERRRERAEKMAEDLPVTDFEICRAHTLAACESLATCKKLTANCSVLLDSCPDSRTESGLPRKELSVCADTLMTIECEARESVIGRLSNNVCRGLNLRTEHNLLPEDSVRTPEPQKGKAPGGSQVNLQRFIQQVDNGNGI